MTKVWDKLKLDPWDYEIELRVDQGMDRNKAEELVIQRWMQAGDLRPLSALIRKHGLLAGPILTLLMQMIENGWLVVNRGRGRPEHPVAATRDEFAADTYLDFQQYYKVGSDDLFRAVAAVCGVSEQTVRQAVTARRSSNKD
jgi:hypothetical protein